MAVTKVGVLDRHLADDVVLVAVPGLREKSARERTQHNLLEHRRIDEESTVGELVTVEDNLVFAIRAAWLLQLGSLILARLSTAHAFT